MVFFKPPFSIPTLSLILSFDPISSNNVKEKIDPYLRPLYDALDDMIPADKLGYYMSTRTIEIAPLAYMRGRTLDNAFIILDESQNANDLQIKMFLTRIGMHSRAVIEGDPYQSDLPLSMRGAMMDVQDKLTGLMGVGVCQLQATDIVRNPIIGRVLERLENR